MNEKEKALERIRKMLTLAEDPAASEGEVENALKMAQSLMAKYDIEYSDVDLSPEDITMIEQEYNPKNNERKYWLWDLLCVIGSSYNCEVLKSRRIVNIEGAVFPQKTWYRQEYFKIFGTKEDVKLIKEIFSRVVPIIRNLAVKRFKEKSNEMVNLQLALGLPINTPNKGKFFNDYIDGFIHGLDLKLAKQKQQLVKEDSSGKYGLILVKKGDLVERFMKETNPKIKSAKSTKVRDINYQTYLQGKKDGETEHEKQIE